MICTNKVYFISFSLFLLIVPFYFVFCVCSRSYHTCFAFFVFLVLVVSPSPPLPPQDGSGDIETALDLKRALPARQLVVHGERQGAGAGMKRGEPRSLDALSALKAGADACVMGVSNPCECGVVGFRVEVGDGGWG